jgi:hypothetical protein
MSQTLILIDALTSVCWEKKKIKRKEKREREMAGFFFFPQGWIYLAGCAPWDFHGY